MRAKFKTYAAMLLGVFLLGALYGVLLDHYYAVEAPAFTGPATVEDLAGIRASMTKPSPPPVKIPDATNAIRP